MRRAAWWLPAVALCAVHCAGSGENADRAPAKDNPDGAQSPAAGDVVAPEAGLLDDDPDDQGADTNGDGADGVVGHDVYVNGDGGADTNDGSPTAPFRTIAAAIRTASQRGGRVLVFAGTYAFERLDAPGAWALYGGYHDRFQGAPKRELTKVTAPATGLLLDVASDVRLSHLTVVGASAPDAAHASAHALRSKVGRLVLEDVAVQSGDGFAGVAGASGAAGADGLMHDGPLVCDGIRQPGYASGAFDTSPEGKPPGDCNAKRRAEPGSNGYPGTDGADATGALSVQDEVVATDAATAGLGDGKPGFGAAGGGSLGNYWHGDGGSGGCPGKGGGGGVSGGASVAILVLSGAVELHRSHLQTGIGGVGGDGGEGGPGGHGGWGGPPSNGGLPAFSTTCKVPSDDPMQANCSAWGGIGGNGGAGGHGGGGAGGATVGVVTAGAATVSVDDATVIATGAPGTGGRGNGGGRAPNGRRAATLHVN